MEFLMQIVRVVERRRERTRKAADSAYLLLNRESFDVVNRRNRMPGILNEAGWTVWGYQTEGFRTFEGDGSRWIWREIGLGFWPDGVARSERRYARRAASSIAAATLASLIPVAGLAYGFSVPVTTFFEKSILVLSAVSYALMAISYYLYARRLHAAPWFAPFWFVAQPAASLLALLRLRRTRSSAREAGAPSEAGAASGSPRRRRGDRARETFRYD
jgi:hypothetical protein